MLFLSTTIAVQRKIRPVGSTTKLTWWTPLDQIDTLLHWRHAVSHADLNGRSGIVGDSSTVAGRWRQSWLSASLTVATASAWADYRVGPLKFPGGWLASDVSPTRRRRPSAPWLSVPRWPREIHRGRRGGAARARGCADRGAGRKRTGVACTPAPCHFSTPRRSSHAARTFWPPTHRPSRDEHVSPSMALFRPAKRRPPAPADRSRRGTSIAPTPRAGHFGENLRGRGAHAAFGLTEFRRLVGRGDRLDAIVGVPGRPPAGRSPARRGRKHRCRQRRRRRRPAARPPRRQQGRHRGAEPSSVGG